MQQLERHHTTINHKQNVSSNDILKRIDKAIDTKLRDEQAGLRPNRGCIGHIFTIRYIIEQIIEWQSKTILNFINFRKAFDSIDRDCLWKILKVYQIPPKIVNIINLSQQI